jgi:hypothetical protein
LKFQKILAVLIVLLLAAGLAPAAAAQNQALQMSVTPAYNGYFKYGEWLPLWVELENQGSDLTGELRVQVNSSSGAIVYAAPVELPAGSRKRVPVYVLPNNFTRELEVVLMSGGRAVTSEKAAVRPQANVSFFIGLITPERGALALLNGVKLPGQERPKILVDLTTAELPDRAEALRSFDVLVLNDMDTSRLTPEQAAALGGWVTQGGRLVIGGGPGAQRAVAGLPDWLLPARLQGTGEINTEALAPLADFAGSSPVLVTGPFVVARGEPNPDTVALVGDASLPLVQERLVGRGAVDFVAVDLTGVPFSGWPGTQDFWQTLISPGAAYPDYLPFDMSQRQMQAQSLTYPLSNIPSLDLPSIRGLSLLLGVYILAVGPLNYLFLRWRRRLHLAWVTIPLLTALFTAGAFGIGYALRGNDLVLNKIAVIELGGEGGARVTSYMGLFSPRQSAYEVTVDSEGLVSPMTGYDPGPWGGGGMPTSGGEMVFYQGQPNRLRGLTVNQWAMQTFMAESTWQAFGDLTGELRIENEVLIGTVRNNTGFPITDVVVTVQNRFERLGDLAPGQEAQVNLGLSSMQNDRFGPPLSYRLFQERFTGGAPSRAAELKSNLISTLFEQYSWGKPMFVDAQPMGGPVMRGGGGSMAPQQGVLVFGWLDQAPPTVDIPNSRLSQQTTGLVYTRLGFNMTGSGFVSLPPGMVPGSVSKMPREGGTCGPITGSPSVHMSRGEAEFQFQIPVDPAEFAVDDIKLSLWRDTGNQWGMPQISVYDWTSESWTTIQEPIQGTNVIQNAAPYVDANGTVLVRITSETDTFGCIYVDMGVEAHRAAGQGG